MRIKEVEFTAGHKNHYRVTVNFENGGKWSPNAAELFEILDKWFKAENEGYGNNFGRSWFKFFIDLVYLGHKEEAIKNSKLSGWKAKNHFKEMVKKFGSEVLQSDKDLLEKKAR